MATIEELETVWSYDDLMRAYAILQWKNESQKMIDDHFKPKKKP